MRFNARDAARRIIGHLGMRPGGMRPGGMRLRPRGTLTRVGGCLLAIVVMAIAVTVWDLPVNLAVASAFNGAATCQARPRSSAGRARRLMI